jgi:hypothetical protein
MIFAAPQTNSSLLIKYANDCEIGNPCTLKQPLYHGLLTVKTFTF